MKRYSITLLLVGSIVFAIGGFVGFLSSLLFMKPLLFYCTGFIKNTKKRITDFYVPELFIAETFNNIQLHGPQRRR